MIYKALFLNQNRKKSEIVFLLAVKKSHFRARVMARTVQLLKHDAYCPIKAEIRAVDSQSDLTLGCRGEGSRC